MLNNKIVELLNKITRYHVISIALPDTVPHFIECDCKYCGIYFVINGNYAGVVFKKRVNIRALNEEAVIADLEEIIGACVEYFGELDNEQ